MFKKSNHRSVTWKSNFPYTKISINLRDKNASIKTFTLLIVTGKSLIRFNSALSKIYKIELKYLKTYNFILSVSV